jgi:hypothetical protein
MLAYYKGKKFYFAWPSREGATHTQHNYIQDSDIQHNETQQDGIQYSLDNETSFVT